MGKEKTAPARWPHRSSVRYAVATAMALASVGIAAQEAGTTGGLQEVVVTATKTGESNVQSTPIAISAFSAESLEQSHAGDVRDLTRLVPNLQVAETDSFAQIFLRGVGSNNVYNGSDPSVTVHVDGVYYARMFMQFANFLDVERVEVLRGPQGTLYGRNSIGGTINVISREPTDDLQAKVSLSGGNYSSLNAAAYLSGALIPGRLEASLAVSRDKHDPYRENIVESGNDVDELDSQAIRGQIKWQVSDSITATTRADYADRDQNLVGFSMLRQPFDAVTNSILGNYDKVALNLPAHTALHLWGASEDINIELSDFLQLKSVTAYRENAVRSIEDGDGTDQSLTEVRLGETQHQFSEELNFIWRFNRFEGVTGLYYFTEDVTTNSSVTLPARTLRAEYRPASTTKAKGVFAQGTYHFTDQWALTLGARYSDEDKDFDQSIIRVNTVTGALAGAPIVYAGTRSFSSVTPKASVNWTPTDALMLYASATRGFKSGGFNFNSPNPGQGFSPETLWSYEVGLKSDWLDHALRANVTAFRYEYKDLQVNSFIIVGQSDIVNAATAKVQGVELELSAAPVKGLRLAANLNWLDAKYKSYPNAPVPGGGFIDASGHRLNYSPKSTASLSAGYTHALSNGGSGYVRGDYSWKDDAFYTAVNSPVVGQSAYAVANASVGYVSPGEQWDFELWGQNLGDKQYLINVYTASVVPAGIPGEPRTYGVRVTWKH